ncbi:MAG: DUF4330 domain-containing protein [Tissierellia bacterium]|nr:DUF4330 domain-containing protein [Tissierellia bacterium]
MKIIDKKGRLFGVINIIDLLFILIILGAIFGGVKRFGGTKIINEPEKQGHAKYMIQNVRQVTVDNIRKGDKVYHYDKGTYIGEIDNIEVEPYREQTEYQGKFYMSEIPERFVVYIDVACDIGENDQTYTIGGEQTKIGNEYRMKSKTSAFWGTCIGVTVEK